MKPDSNITAADFEFPGLTEKLNNSLLGLAKGSAPGAIHLSTSETIYLLSCVSYYVSDQLLKRCPAGLPVINADLLIRPH